MALGSKLAALLLAVGGTSPPAGENLENPHSHAAARQWQLVALGSALLLARGQQLPGR